MSGSIRSSLRTLVGTLLPLGEDPETLLDHLFGDLEAIVPPLDQQLHWLSAGVRLLDQELEGLNQEEPELVQKIATAARTSKPALAAALAERLAALRTARGEAHAQHEVLRRSQQLALEVKRRVLQGVQERCREVARSLPTEVEAQWRGRISVTVSRLAKAQLTPELTEEILAVEAAALETERSRPLPVAGKQDADLAPDIQRVDAHPLVAEVEAQAS